MAQSTGRKQFFKERGVVYLMTFIMGGCGIAYEYTFSKISSDLLGNSVVQWAVTIGLMMFFMGIGSDLQKHLSDRHLFDKFLVFEILLGMIGAFGPILLLYFFGVSRDHYVLVQYASITSVGFLIGLEIPILTRINEHFTTELKANIGGVLRMDYVGAFAGALVWVFVLPRFFTLVQMSFVLGLLNLLTAGVALYYFRSLVYRKKSLIAFISTAVMGLILGFSMAPTWTRYSEQKLYLNPIVFSATTRYQHIVLTRSHGGDLFCYINGHTQFSSFDEFIYHEFLVHPIMSIAPRHDRVLVLGGGDGLAVRELLKYPDVKSVTLVDLDPEMTRLARANPELSALNENSLQNAKVRFLENHALSAVPGKTEGVFSPDRTQLFESEYYPTVEVSIVNIDAAQFINQISGTFDVIVLDFPDPSNLELSKLYSKSFYQQLHSKLSRDGILVQQSTSPIYSKDAFLCIGRTMNAAGLSALPFHENVPVFGEWGWWMGCRKDSYLARDMRKKLENLDELSVPVRYLTTDLVRASLAFGKSSFKTQETEVNTIVNNVIFRYYVEGALFGD